MNKKGFTLVELLAVISIMGILAGVAIVSVSVYLDKAKNQAYDNLFDTTYDAAVNYLMTHSSEVDRIKKGQSVEIKTADLVSGGYMETPMDPNNKNVSCLSGSGSNMNYVSITNSGSSSEKLDQFTYYIYVSCGDKTASKTYPKE